METRPGRRSRLCCPRCGCHTRDRLVWQLVTCVFGAPSLRILEVGGTQRLREPLRARYDYVNADVVDRPLSTDALIVGGTLPLPPRSRDLVLMSHVLGAIVDRAERVRLLTEARRVVVDHGRLLLLDDLDFTTDAHEVLPPGTYFHAMRFGRDLFWELREAGWSHQVVSYCAVAAELAAHRELPYVVAVPRTSRGERIMIEDNARGGDKPAVHKPATVSVVVRYVGRERFSHSLTGSVSIGDLKKKVMDAFGLEQSAASKYALSYRGVTLNERFSIGTVAGTLFPERVSDPRITDPFVEDPFTIDLGLTHELTYGAR